MQTKQLKQKGMKAMALVMSGLFVFGTVCPVSAKTKQTEKEETVYVNAAASGEVEQVIVSNWLKNKEKTDEIKDYSELENIKNVKGDEDYTKEKDGSLTWKSSGNDIYYQGETKKDLPVSMKVTYYLDGKETEPESLAGKSGKVRIRFDYENHSSETVKVDGKKYEVKTPFTMVTAMILPTDTFSNVEVTNGKVISDGDKEIVVGLAFPGLTDSLQLSSYETLSDLSLPDYVEVTTDAEEFELALTATVATTGNLSEINTDKIEDAGDLKDDLNKLTDASSSLVKGTEDLLEGMNSLNTSFGTYKKGVDSADKGAKELEKGLKTLDSKKEELKKGAMSLTEGIGNLKQGTTTLKQGISDYTSGVSSLEEGIGSAAAGVTQLQTGAQALSAGLTSYLNNAVELKNGIAQMNQMLSNTKVPDEAQLNQVNQASAALEADAKKLESEIEQLNKAIQKINSLKNDLESYEKSLNAAVSQAKDAADHVNSKANEQANSQAKSQVEAAVRSMDQLTEEEKNKIINSIHVEVDAASEVKEALNQIPSFEAPDIQVETGDMESVLADMGKQAKILESFAKEVSGLTNNLPKLKTGLANLDAGAKKLTGANDNLLAGMKQLETGIKTLSGGMDALGQGAKKLTDTNKSLEQGAGAVDQGATQLEQGGKQLSSGIDALNSGIGKLADGSKKLSKGTGTLSEAGDLLTGGIGQLTSGAGTLNSGMKEFDQDGIGKLADLAGDDLENVIHHFQAVKKADQNYSSFTGIGDGTKGNVKFLIETAPIEKK